MSHTPGPWQFVNAWGPLEFDGRHRFLKCVGADYQTVLCTNDRSFDIQARLEDMRLIVASPKLLEALKQVIASARPNPKDHPAMFAAWEIAQAAIAEAEGMRLERGKGEDLEAR